MHLQARLVRPATRPDVACRGRLARPRAGAPPGLGAAAGAAGPGRLAAAAAAALPAEQRRFTAVLPPDAAAARARARPGPRSSRTRTGCSRASGRCSASSAPTWTQPDWFYDPVTGRRSAPDAYAFSLNQRDEAAVGNIKQVWEVNRLQHLTLLAVAWYLTGEDAYAERVAEQLRSWWRENPFLSGVNWTSGIELGVRLINFAWIRRLLDGWPRRRGPVRAQ